MGQGSFTVASGLTILLLLAPTVMGAESGCQRITYPGGSIDQCGYADGEKDDESFWTSPLAQTLYALAGFAASGGAFFFGWNRVRQRRRTMHQLLSDIETTYVTAKDEPQAGIEHLLGIRGEIKTRHASGKLSDSQFLGLESKILDHITKLRLLELESLFPKLPADLMTEIRTLLEDAHVSSSDVARIDARAASLRVGANTRRALTKHLQTWAAKDSLETPKPKVELQLSV